ncbi:MAG: hypothetical protein IE886_07025 [Campylobacterales bacterium]|nr:hypothetical protein [Campylobacterales bacterium]
MKRTLLIGALLAAASTAAFAGAHGDSRMLLNSLDLITAQKAQVEKLQSIGLDRTPQNVATLLETAVSQLYLSAERRQALRIIAAPGVSIDADAPSSSAPCATCSTTH